MQAYNFTTQVKYGGSNAGLKGNGDLNAFATFFQIKNAGYTVNKGAKGIQIFTGYYTKTDPKTNEEKTVPTHALVFDIKDTSAYEDKEFIDYLKNEAVIVDSKDVADMKLVSAMI